MKVVGIDLSGNEKRASGICILNEKFEAECFLLKKDKEIISLIKKEKPDLVAIDAPLSLPLGRKSLDKKEKVHFRECDKELWKYGIKFLPITLGPMRELTKRGIKIRIILESMKFKVIEVYPGATQDLLKIPRKQRGLEKLKRGLENLGINFDKENLTHDELDAATAAYTGYLFLIKKAIEVGNEKEGTIVIPLIE